MEKILEEIKNNYNKDYAQFSSKLIPGIDAKNMCGIKIPIAKKIAKNYANTPSGNNFLNNAKLDNLDQKNIYGLMLGFLKENTDKIIEYLNKFLPQINNWCTCDITVANLKIIKKYPQIFKKMAFLWLKNDNFYIKRFAVVILLDYFLEDFFDENDLKILSNFNFNDYYFNMALAWYFSVAMVKQPKLTIQYFQQNLIKNNFVHNKAIQKCIESFRIDKNTKNLLKILKRY